MLSPAREQRPLRFALLPTSLELDRGVNGRSGRDDTSNVAAVLSKHKTQEKERRTQEDEGKIGYFSLSWKLGTVNRRTTSKLHSEG